MTKASVLGKRCQQRRYVKVSCITVVISATAVDPLFRLRKERW